MKHKKMVILGDKKVEIITSERMLKEFGSIIACTPENGVLYINQEILEKEKRKFGKYISTEEIVEDFYRVVRKINMRKTKRNYPTVWNELLRRHIDPKYRIPINV